MKKSTITIILLTILATNTIAFTATPNQEKLQITPNGHTKQEIDIGLKPNQETELEITDLPENITAIPEKTRITDNTTLELYYIAEELDWEEKEVQKTFTISTKQLNETEKIVDGLNILEHQPVKDSENVTYGKKPLDDNHYTILHEKEIIQLDTSKIENYSDEKPVKINYKYSKENTETHNLTTKLTAELPPEEQEADIDILSSGPFERGDWVNIKIFNNADKESIRGCTIKSFGGGEDNVEELETTSTTQIKIPEELESKTYTLQITDCPEEYKTGHTEEIELTTWKEHLAQNKLVISDLKTEGEKVTGQINNENGDPIEDNLKLLINDGERTKEPEESEFELTLNKTDNYTIQAVRTDKDSSEYDSEKNKVEIFLDDDGDKVPNYEDECPETEGIKENDGCPLKKLDINVEGEKTKEGELIKGETYTIKVYGENKTPAKIDNIKLKDEDNTQTLNIDNNKTTFKPEKEGVYTISTPDNKQFEDVREAYTATEKQLNIKKVGMVVGGLTMLLLIILVATMLKNKSGSTGEDLKVNLEPDTGGGE